VAAVNGGRVGLARQLLARARDRAVDPELVVRIEISQAYVAMEVGDPAEAARLCESALANPAIADADRGVALGQLAMVHMRRGEAVAALAAFTTAIDLLAASPTDLARALGNRGDVYLHQGEARSAVHDLERAAELFAEQGAEIDVAKARHNLGYALFLEGDLVGALAAMESAAPLLATVSPVLKAIGEQDRAEVLLTAGLFAEGGRLLHDAAHDYGVRRLRRRQAEAELTLAARVVDEDPRRARRLARAAGRRFERLQLPAWVSRAAAVEVACDVELGRAVMRDSTRATEEALVAAGLPSRAETLRLHTARSLVRHGDLRGARTLVRGRGPAVDAALAVRLLDRDVRAELASAQGRRANALQHLRTGLADLHAWQSSFGSLDLQTGVAGAGRRLGVRGLALAVESRKPAVLFEWSERARMLASRVQQVRAPEDEQIVADLAELREMAAEEGHRDAAREAELRQRVRERAWQHRGSGEVTEPVTLDELTATLDGETALIAYVVTADAVVALVVADSGPTWVDLGHREELDRLLGGLLPDLDMAASDLPGAMAAFVRVELADRLGALADLLVTPVLEAVGSRRVVLTPSGVLAGVPWTLLPGYTGRPVTVAQSATAWLARRTTPLRTTTAGFVAGPRVARAEDEVTAAAKEWMSAQVLTGTDATASAVSELAESVDVLHVAAHGRHSAENAMFAGVQLADGPWFGYDIDRLRQVPDVVLLSACEVGRSTVRWGQELVGMATAWLHAGTRCVIASPAAINDRAAYDVLLAVHHRLASGLDPAAALAEAVPAVSGDSPPVPLVCFG
jgi:CHAT domain-containing protein/tetratricopeptide (TPR) repeat protein